MAWSDLIDEEKEAELRALDSYDAHGSADQQSFGMPYDVAAAEGAEFGLTATHSSARSYAAMLNVVSIDDYRRAEANADIRARARVELDLERTKAELRGAS